MARPRYAGTRSSWLLVICAVASCLEQGAGQGPFRCSGDVDCAWGHVCDLSQDPAVCARPVDLRDAAEGGDGGPRTDAGGFGDAAAIGDATIASDVTVAGDAAGRPSVFVSGETFPAYIALDDTYVYWTSNAIGGEVRRASKAAPIVETLTTIEGPRAPLGIAIDDVNVYVVADGVDMEGDSVWSAPKGATATQPLLVADSMDFTYGRRSNNLFATGGAVYWLNFSSTGDLPSILRYTLGESANSYEVARARGRFAGGLVRCGDFAFLSETDTRVAEEISIVPLDFVDGAVMEAFADPEPGEAGVGSAAGCNGVATYWSVKPNSDTEEPGGVVEVSLSGETTRVVDQIHPSDLAAWVFALVVDDRDLYYIAASDYSSGLYRCALEEGASVERVADIESSGGLAMDSTHVYWNEFEAGEIRRLIR